MSNHGAPDLHTAIMKSCDGYFYRFSRKMKLEGIEKVARAAAGLRGRRRLR